MALSPFSATWRSDIARLLNKLTGNGNLGAIAGLTGANGNIIVFTGPGAVASRPITGTVSQSGGIPNGALFEIGSNANGVYERSADGAQKCFHMIDITSLSMETATGSIFTPTTYYTWNYPASFVGTPTVTAIFRRPSLIQNGCGLYSLSSSLANIVPWNGAALAAGTAKFISIEAEGRWF